jgi:hypothetical protein
VALRLGDGRAGFPGPFDRSEHQERADARLDNRRLAEATDVWGSIVMRESNVPKKPRKALRLDEMQVEVVHLRGNRTLMTAAGPVILPHQAAIPREGFYLALRPIAAPPGDYSGSYYVGPSPSFIIATKLRLSALALGAKAAPELAATAIDEYASGLLPRSATEAHDDPARTIARCCIAG